MNGRVRTSSIGEESSELLISRTASVILLLASTALVAVCAEFLVDPIYYLVKEGPLSKAFICLIILPIVGSAAEHVTAVTVAAKNKMDLAIGVAIGSSIQIALLFMPVIVILGWILDKDMSLFFTLFENTILFVSTFVVNFLVLDGRNCYFEGVLLTASYIIIAIGAFFFPDGEDLNRLVSRPS
jgi:Ca2+:H+ antiporter